MQTYNHSWEIDKWRYYEVAQPVGIFDDFLHLYKNGNRYKMPTRFISLYVPTNKFFIEINKVNKFLERVNVDNL